MADDNRTDGLFTELRAAFVAWADSFDDRDDPMAGSHRGRVFVAVSELAVADALDGGE